MPGAPPTRPDDGCSTAERFHPVSVERASNVIVEQVRVLIREGRLSAGDRLPSQRDMGERLGVSRTTVRVALRRLEASGLVTIRVGARGGAFVTLPSSQGTGEGISELLSFSALTPARVIEARQVLDMAIVPLVCERADALDIVDLLEICDRADAALAAGTPYPLSLSVEFHSRMTEATKNPAIAMFERSFAGPMLDSPRHAHDEDRQRSIQRAAEHRMFVEAVADRDTEAAQAIMRRHLACIT